MDKEEKIKKEIKILYQLMMGTVFIFCLIAGMFFYIIANPSAFVAETEEYIPISGIDNQKLDNEDFDKIENGIHVRSGFVEGEGLMLVVNNCTNCHSAKLVTQNRMSKERWLATIRWMQETQNLWDLGVNEDAIVNYLATYYAPSKNGRRKNLANIEWYELE